MWQRVGLIIDHLSHTTLPGQAPVIWVPGRQVIAIGHRITHPTAPTLYSICHPLWSREMLVLILTYRPKQFRACIFCIWLYILPYSAKNIEILYHIVVIIRIPFFIYNFFLDFPDEHKYY